jgi:tetratricopeptide (TPR) repeat protein
LNKEEFFAAMISFKTINEVETTEQPDELKELVAEFTDCLKKNTSLDDLLKHYLFKDKLEPIANIQNSSIHSLQFVVFKTHANNLQKLGDLHAALAFYLKAYQLNSADFTLSFKIAKLYSELNQHQDSYDFLLECFLYSFQKGDRVFYGQALSRFLFNYGLFPDCFTCCNMLLQIDPENSIARSLKYEILTEHLQGSKVLQYLFLI